MITLAFALTRHSLVGLVLALRCFQFFLFIIDDLFRDRLYFFMLSCRIVSIDSRQAEIRQQTSFQISVLLVTALRYVPTDTQITFSNSLPSQHNMLERSSEYFNGSSEFFCGHKLNSFYPQFRSGLSSPIYYGA